MARPTPPMPKYRIEVFYSDEDEGYIMSIIQAPSGASLEYTTNIAKQAEAVMLAQPETRGVFSVVGFSFTGSAPNGGMMFTALKDWSERRDPSHSLTAVLNRIRGPLFGIPGGMVFPACSTQV